MTLGIVLEHLRAEFIYAGSVNRVRKLIDSREMRHLAYTFFRLIHNYLYYYLQYSISEPKLDSKHSSAILTLPIYPSSCLSPSNSLELLNDMLPNLLPHPLLSNPRQKLFNFRSRAIPILIHRIPQFPSYYPFPSQSSLCLNKGLYRLHPPYPYLHNNILYSTPRTKFPLPLPHAGYQLSDRQPVHKFHKSKSRTFCSSRYSCIHEPGIQSPVTSVSPKP
jgi:hypothetical protein